MIETVLADTIRVVSWDGDTLHASEGLLLAIAVVWFLGCLVR